MIRTWLSEFEQGVKALERLPKMKELEAEAAYNARLYGIAFQFIPATFLSMYILSHLDLIDVLFEPLPHSVLVASVLTVPLIHFGTKFIMKLEIKRARSGN
jgi:hypothetical protein